MSRVSRLRCLLFKMCFHDGKSQAHGVGRILEQKLTKFDLPPAFRQVEADLTRIPVNRGVRSIMMARGRVADPPSGPAIVVLYLRKVR